MTPSAPRDRRLLRYQACEYDCVPTCFVNALVWLFPRKAIPPDALQRIYLYTLDAVGRGGTHGRGTGGTSIALLCEWLESYRTKHFGVSCTVLEEADVHLRQGNRIVGCLNEDGVVLCTVCLPPEEHYVLALRADSEWLYFFDPYLRSAIRAAASGARLLVDDPDGANLAVRRDWLDTASNRKHYTFGSQSNRQAVLLTRVR